MATQWSRLDLLSEEQKQTIRKAFEYGFEDSKISRSLNIHALQIYYYRHYLGITKSQITVARLNTWMNLIKSGSTLEDIVETYGLKNPNVVKRQLWKAGFSLKKHTLTELTPEQKAAALALVKEGAPDLEIARAIKAKEFEVLIFLASQGISNRRKRRATKPVPPGPGVATE